MDLGSKTCSDIQVIFSQGWDMKCYWSGLSWGYKVLKQNPVQEKVLENRTVSESGC